MKADRKKVQQQDVRRSARKVKATPTANKGGFGLIASGEEDGNSQDEAASELDVESEAREEAEDEMIEGEYS